MKKVYLAFLWHQHQPIYKNPETNTYELPWVRLHATKDYYDMVAALDNFPKVKANFNLVPSLLIQLEEYASGKAKDVFMDLTLKDAAALNNHEKTFILTRFFMANWDNMIAPNKRYLEIFNKRGSNTAQPHVANIVKDFTEQDFRDLQVWFNLAWMDPYWIKNDEFISFLYAKGENFSEEEKQKLIQKQIEICAKVVEKYKQAQDNGQIEVSVTPFYHPILPLLCDTNSAREAAANIDLPSQRFTHPEDAAAQIEKSAAYYEKVFGFKPKGMWPSEGSVSDAAVKLIENAGVKWIATDEAVLFNSVKEINANRKFLFRPFKTGNTNIIFRDHGLSDLIGFVYSKWNPEDAANDFLSKIRGIADYVGNDYDAPLVSVILDGENCWEYYKNDGWDFLTKLYEKLSADETIETVRISDYLEKFPPKDEVKKLTAGSWINGNFYVWIGHSEDNTSWDYLSLTRDFLTTYIEQNPQCKGSAAEKKAWDLLYAAEGSDWNWWYGDDHSSSSDDIFDYLYRKHLIEIYKLFGVTPPASFYEPINKFAKKRQQLKPVAHISPKIDGRESTFTEWHNAGCYVTKSSGGAMHKVAGLIDFLYYGVDNENLFLRIDLNASAIGRNFDNMSFNLNITSPENSKVSLIFNSQKQIIKFSAVTGGQEKSIDLSNAAYDSIIELAVPFWAVNIPADYAKIEFNVAVEENGQEVESWPENDKIIIEK
ncbi:glycoside hydrolase family 57 protein [Endomicrobium proavitum]|uniref:Amylopullulanase n=1 Tax=Endomicrobium proavitum TaxID=1408281 RepID=A0A0G3WK66_9BACT|nr:glycoside hydrolase family 57 protein [Endomicrobium proavitum]AKL97894.1 Amylopullulanase [Endomicrobium proavitum]